MNISYNRVLYETNKMDKEKETSTWKLILIVIILLLSLLIPIVALLVNLSALNGIEKIAFLKDYNNYNYSDLEIDENGKYECSWKEHFNGLCKIKCIKSCELINSNSEGGNVCVC